MNRQQKTERTICKFIAEAPRAMYDLGVGPADGRKTEWQTLADTYPKMRIFGCEPDPFRARALRAIFPGSLYEFAIGHTSGRMRLNCDLTGKRSASFLNLGGLTHLHEVEVISLDQFDALCGSPDRVLLWMDLEGSELDAIVGGRELLASNRVRWINIEVGRPGYRPKSAGWPSPVDVLVELRSLGFVRVHTYNRHRTHEDWIFRHVDEPPGRQ